MAEEQQGQEKTEDATPRREQKSREEGQVARSRELNSMALVTAGAVGLMLFAPWAARRLLSLTAEFFRSAAAADNLMLESLSSAATETVWILLPVLSMIFVAGVGSTVAVGGLVLSSKAMAFKGSRLDPLKGLKRMFSLKSLMELFKSLAKFGLISGAAVLTLSVLVEDLLHLGFLDIDNAIADGLTFVTLALLLIGSTLVIIAAIDIPFQIAQHKKQLKMTKQEVKDEMKDTEGKPEVKSRIRQVQQEISRRRMLQDVPQADVVITNPEHYSVAIRYDSESMAVPIVVAKGADLLALRIREIAVANEVPLLPVPALTRAVYYATELGDEIPSGLYMAVAQVLAYIHRLRDYRSGQGAKPQPPVEFEIPDELSVEPGR